MDKESYESDISFFVCEYIKIQWIALCHEKWRNIFAGPLDRHGSVQGSLNYMI